MIGNFFTLADYLLETRDLLHDPESQYWRRAQLVNYINRAKRRRDLDTEQNRVQFTMTLTVNQDIYSLFDLAAQNPEPPGGPTNVTTGASSIVVPVVPTQTVGYSVLASASWDATVTVSAVLAGSFTASFSEPAPAGGKLYWQLYGNGIAPNASRVFDLVGITLLYNNVRVVMGQFSLSELNTTVRQYMPPLSWAPVRFARYGPNGVIFAPAPSSAYNTEWDCATIGAPLVYDQDADLLPYPYTNSVPYYAAYLAKLNERQNEEAAELLTQYDTQMQAAQNSRVGMVANMYSSGVTRL